MSKKISTSINNEKLPPSGTLDFLTILTLFEKDKRDNEKRLKDYSNRKFEIIMILSKQYQIYGDIDFSDDLKSGNSFLKIDGKVNKLIFKDDFGNTISGFINTNFEISAFNGFVNANNNYEAFKIFNQIIIPVIDNISYHTNCPIIVSKLICKDIKNDTQTTSYIVPYQNEIMNPHYGKIYIELKPIFALYREAKNNTSPYYRFLCYYKILEGVFTKLRPEMRKRAKEKEIKWYDEEVPDNSKIEIHKECIGKNVKEVYDKIFRPKYRNLIAHFRLDNGDILNISEFHSNNTFNDLIILLEICVRVVLDNQIKYYNQ